MDPAPIDFAAARAAMVEQQLERRGIADPQILAAFRAVPREAFVAPAQASLAYGDHPLPIGAGQTISQPYIVALMIEAAAVAPGDRVLEVGAGSGYAAAILGQVAGEVVAVERVAALAAGEVVAVERVAALAAGARERMARLGYANVRIVTGDGTLGWPDDAPFDAILAAASGSHVPQALIDQLKPGGRLVMPLGDPGAVQYLVKLTRRRDGSIARDTLCAVRFVPLIGAQGFRDDAVAPELGGA